MGLPLDTTSTKQLCLGLKSTKVAHSLAFSFLCKTLFILGSFEIINQVPLTSKLICLFSPSSNKDLLSTYYVLNVVLGVRSCLMEQKSSVEYRCFEVT